MDNRSWSGPKKKSESKKLEKICLCYCGIILNWLCHLIGKQYKCQTCGKEFEQKKTLKRHELYFHQELSSQTVCTQCGKRFKHPQSLKDHLVLHAQGEAFDGKPKTYSNEVKQEALNHLQNHTKAEVARILNIHYKSINNWEAATKKKFVCRFCGKKLCSEQRLKQHESSQHENNKEWIWYTD